MKSHESFRETITLLTQDYKRYIGDMPFSPFFFIAKFFHNSGMIFSVFYRFQRYFQFHPFFLLRMLGYAGYPIYFWVTYYLLDYHIEPDVAIGGGLFLHNRSIVIANNAILGKNVSIMGQVTIGTGFTTNHFTIRIGDNIQIGSGAKIIAKGKLSIVNNVTIGANAVVTKDIVESGVYAGVPARRLNKRNKR